MGSRKFGARRKPHQPRSSRAPRGLRTDRRIRDLKARISAGKRATGAAGSIPGAIGWHAARGAGMAITTASGRNDEAGRPAASPPPADRKTSAGPDRPSATELGFPVTMLALAEAGQ